eukprot:1985381-Pyramimonas_sp.AAC.1
MRVNHVTARRTSAGRHGNVRPCHRTSMMPSSARSMETSLHGPRQPVTSLFGGPLKMSTECPARRSPS